MFLQKNKKKNYVDTPSSLECSVNHTMKSFERQMLSFFIRITLDNTKELF